MTKLPGSEALAAACINEPCGTLPWLKACDGNDTKYIDECSALQLKLEEMHDRCVIQS